MRVIGHGHRACACALLIAAAWGAPWPARAAPLVHAGAQAAAPASAPALPAANESYKTDAAPYSVTDVARMLAKAPPHDVLHLNYSVIVAGQAPPPELFRNFNLTEGPVPFGAPTAEQFRSLTTPDAFKTPAIPFAPLVDWLVSRIRHH